jgi:hypothetical protein
MNHDSERATTERDKAIWDIEAGYGHHFTDRFKSMLGAAYDAGRRDGLEQAAVEAKRYLRSQEDLLHVGEKVAAAIRAQK